MQKVNLKKKQELGLEDLKDSMLIGVRFERDSRGFVTKIHDGKYIISSLEHNEGFISKIEGKTIKHLIDSCVNVEEVVVLDSGQELSEWLLEQFNK